MTDSRADFDALPTGYPDGFPFKKLLYKKAGRFGYVVPLTFGRGRINVTTISDLDGVTEFY